MNSYRRSRFHRIFAFLNASVRQDRRRTTLPVAVACLDDDQIDVPPRLRLRHSRWRHRAVEERSERKPCWRVQRFAAGRVMHGSDHVLRRRGTTFARLLNPSGRFDEPRGAPAANASASRIRTTRVSGNLRGRLPPAMPYRCGACQERLIRGCRLCPQAWCRSTRCPGSCGQAAQRPLSSLTATSRLSTVGGIAVPSQGQVDSTSLHPCDGTTMTLRSLSEKGCRFPAGDDRLLGPAPDGAGGPGPAGAEHGKRLPDPGSTAATATGPAGGDPTVDDQNVDLARRMPQNATDPQRTVATAPQ